MSNSFLFEIGSVLTHKAFLIEPVIMNPIRLFVVERQVQQCPGGVQKHYTCRVLDYYGDKLEQNLRTFNEVELALLPEAKPMESIGELISALERETRRARRWFEDVEEWAEQLKKRQS